jgi:general secretion pathway protein I
MIAGQPKHASRADGFTLLEVLVAMAILAIALGAALATTESSARSADAVTGRLLSHWVAMNQIAEVQLGLKPINGDRVTGSEDMAGRHFLWEGKVTATADAHVRKLVMKVRDGTRGPVLARLTAYLGVQK